MRRAALLAAAAPLLLAACGGSSSSSSSTVTLTPVAYVKQAAKQSSQASSEHVDLKGVVTEPGTTFALTGSGDFDNAKKLAQLTIHANLQGLDMQIDGVMDGTTVYFKSPIFAAALPAGKSWLKLDLEKAGQAGGVDLSQLLGQDPAQAFAQLQASGRVTKVADETIDGVDTTHYRGRIDPAKLPQAAKIKALANAKYGPYDVWIGKDDGLVHRVKSSYTAQGRGVALTMNFSDFGKDVSVDVPPADETVNATKKSLPGLGG